MAMINIEGQDIFFTRPAKTINGPEIVLVHGAGGSHLGWPKEIQRLPGANVYNLDLPGHGRSFGPGRFSIETYADVVQAFLKQLNLNDVTLVGHSMGGAIALSLTIRQLPQISNLIIIDSSARLRVSPQLLELTISDPQAAADLLVQMSWSSRATEEQKRLSLINTMQTEPVVLHGDFSACDVFDVRKYLDRIQKPTLIICGMEDRMTPAKYSQELANSIRDAKLVMIKGAGHFSMLEKPEEVAAIIAAFLKVSD